MIRCERGKEMPLCRRLHKTGSCMDNMSVCFVSRWHGGNVQVSVVRVCEDDNFREEGRFLGRLVFSFWGIREIVYIL